MNWRGAATRLCSCRFSRWFSEEEVAARASPLVVEELAVESDHDAVACRIGSTLDIELEVDGAHDPVAELLVNRFLDRRAVDTKGFVEAVDGRIDRVGAVLGPSRRPAIKSKDDSLVEAQ